MLGSSKVSVVAICRSFPPHSMPSLARDYSAASFGKSASFSCCALMKASLNRLASGESNKGQSHVMQAMGKEESQKERE